jgi:hypothetical protein
VVLSMTLIAITITVLPLGAKKKEQAPEPVLYPFSEMLENRRVTVLPIIDNRPDKKENINIGQTQGFILKELKWKGYSPVRSDEVTRVLDGMTEDDVKNLRPDTVKQIGSQGERWVFVALISDVAAKRVLGSTAHAEMYGFLFDKDMGKVAWSDRGVGQVTSSGLMGMTDKGAVKSESQRVAVQRILRAFPLLPDPKTGNISRSKRRGKR